MLHTFELKRITYTPLVEIYRGLYRSEQQSWLLAYLSLVQFIFGPSYFFNVT